MVLTHGQISKLCLEPVSFRAFGATRYSKELQLLRHVLRCEPTDPGEVCRAIEDFGLAKRSRWLKVAGTGKAQVLEARRSLKRTTLFAFFAVPLGLWFHGSIILWLVLRFRSSAHFPKTPQSQAIARITSCQWKWCHIPQAVLRGASKGNILEIGTYCGYSALRMHLALRHLQDRFVIGRLAVDPFGLLNFQQFAI